MHTTSDVQKLENLIELSNDISEIKDFDVLMERILGSARSFVNCDAGSIYIRDGDNLVFSYTQNDTLARGLESGQKLIYNTFTMPITKSSIAGYVATTGEVLNIPDVYVIDGRKPYSFNKSFDQSAGYRSRSMLTVPLKRRTGEVTGVLQLINAFDDSDEVNVFDPTVEPFVKYIANNASGAIERAQLMRTIILRMISMAELRDPKETGSHVNRVAGYSVEIYETLAHKKKIPQRDIDSVRDVLRMSAMLHDVGKVAISDIILKKPARLSEDEFEIMKQHTLLGAKLFLNPSSPFEEAAREVALNHHERWDGHGYPGWIDPFTGAPLPGKVDENGKPIPKREDEIPLFGRIVALADVYDALSNQRSYKEAWDEDRVLSVITEERGKHFDPDVVDAFFTCLPTIRSIANRYPSEI
jgi:hypothetical protein